MIQLVKIYFSFLCLLLLLGASLHAQTVSGTINNYAQVTSIGSNNASVNVANTAGFFVGDTVLIIQMKGAIIYDLNNASYGNVTDYNGAGGFETAVICDVNANTISFNAQLLNTYDVLGFVQVISIPKYENVSINGTLTGQAWNGTTGGVIVLEATNTITLNADIDATGIGFRGGSSDSSAYNCAWFDNFPDYTYDITTGYAAMKGEGIAVYGTETAGKGALANGGGGGNDHNSGGGGGANTIYGGRGGNNDDPNANNCTGFHPGIGGKGLSGSVNSVFLGGGGGAGHANNNSTTDGGTGGGIVILIANKIEGNGNTIFSNGTNGGSSVNDGAGGGGAGGSILLYSSSVESIITLEAKGENGGSVDANTSNRCYGPGGGGSGGFIWHKNSSTPSNVTSILTGGTSGIVTNSAASCNGQSIGAADGQIGVENYNLIVGTNAIDIDSQYEDLGNNQSLCIGEAILLTAPEATSYYWSTGSTQQVSLVVVPGDYHVTVFFGNCVERDTILVDFHPNPETVLPSDTILCSYLGVNMNAGNEGSSYNWSTGETTQITNTTEEGEFNVTITTENSCTAVDEITVNACANNLEIPNLITPNGDGNNDSWIIETIFSYPGNSVEIYNRNGALLFQTENYNNNWNGENLPASTYFYVIDFNNGGNKQYGSISIVREK
ncbi:MAG: gliding motility-associated C-terminal domain-containing protein [Flavobacteriales bacterium]|nr:gliding motility-associated C-terminal domain-containing protein [Flavobacteriales bacterium]